MFRGDASRNGKTASKRFRLCCWTLGFLLFLVGPPAHGLEEDGLIFYDGFESGTPDFDGVPCSVGEAVQLCGPGQTCCSDVGCCDLEADPEACGGCGNACSSTNVDVAICESGLCQPVCTSGWTSCSSPAFPALDDGCETLETATTCGPACEDCTAMVPLNSQSEGCLLGACAYSCTEGWDDCDAEAGCEADLGAVTSCGSCGNDCEALAVDEYTASVASCSESGCTFQCDPDQSGPDPIDLTHVETVVCPIPYDEFIEIASCVEGRYDCDGDATNGCEQTLPCQRVLVAADTSGSMGLDLDGVPTFGDGVLTGCSLESGGAGSGNSIWCGADCTAGLDIDCDGLTNDSRTFQLSSVLREAVDFLFGDVEVALARFEQSQSEDASCLTVSDMECNAGGPYVTSFGNPQCNTGSVLGPTNCSTGAYAAVAPIPDVCEPGKGFNTALMAESVGDPTGCINYAGGCSGGDILVGFPDLGPLAGLGSKPSIRKWVDHAETAFDPSTMEGDFCGHSGVGDCELRPIGYRSIDGVLTAALSYLQPILENDSAPCRPYAVILFLGGAEVCGGDPVTRAGELLSAGIETYVVGLGSNLDMSTQSALNAIATAGGTDAGVAGGDAAYFAVDPASMEAALVEVLERTQPQSCSPRDLP